MEDRILNRIKEQIRRARNGGKSSVSEDEEEEELIPMRRKKRSRWNKWKKRQINDNDYDGGF